MYCLAHAVEGMIDAQAWIADDPSTSRCRNCFFVWPCMFWFHDGRRCGQQREGGNDEREGYEGRSSHGDPEMEPVSDGLLRLASVVVRTANQACTLHLGKMQVG